MTDYTKMNAYFEYKCGVRFTSADTWYLPSQLIANNFTWDIRDPRCREIVREKFRLTTTPSQIDGTFTCSRYKGLQALSTATGKTIREAEIACLENIYMNEGEGVDE